MKSFHGKILLAAACFLATLQAVSLGHAFVDHAAPKVGSTEKTSPAEVKIWFTEEIEPALSSIKVLDSAGHQVDKKDCHIDKADKKLLIVTVPENLPAGTYKVVWSVVATDTHPTHGDFKFTVKSP